VTAPNGATEDSVDLPILDIDWGFRQAGRLLIVRQIQAAGVTSTRDIAAALNARGIRTARGGEWHHSTVRNLLARGT